MSRDRLLLTLLALATAIAPVASRAQGLASLDCDDVDAAAVRDVLAHAPAPRVLLIAGSLPFVTMDPFARFLIGMGYPEGRIADPRSGALSVSGYEDGVKLAGIVAWYYEHDGMAPMLIGHSRGGMLVMRTLHELAGDFHHTVTVHDPERGEALARTTIVDPYTGQSRPITGIRVPYAAAIATGKLPRLLQGQWSMLSRLRVVPDTVVDFAGFRIEGDLIAADLGDDPYVAQGSAHVRNVTLPSSYSHIDAPRAAHLAADPVTRAWIDRWRPDRGEALPQGHDTTNLLLAADIWYGVKRGWCRAAQARSHRGGAS